MWYHLLSFKNGLWESGWEITGYFCFKVDDIWPETDQSIIGVICDRSGNQSRVGERSSMSVHAHSIPIFESLERERERELSSSTYGPFRPIRMSQSSLDQMREIGFKSKEIWSSLWGVWLSIGLVGWSRPVVLNGLWPGVVTTGFDQRHRSTFFGVKEFKVSPREPVV